MGRGAGVGVGGVKEVRKGGLYIPILPSTKHPRLAVCFLCPARLVFPSVCQPSSSGSSSLVLVSIHERIVFFPPPAILISISIFPFPCVFVLYVYVYMYTTGSIETRIPKSKKASIGSTSLGHGATMPLPNQCSARPRPRPRQRSSFSTLPDPSPTFLSPKRARQGTKEGWKEGEFTCQVTWRRPGDAHSESNSMGLDPLGGDFNSI